MTIEVNRKSDKVAIVGFAPSWKEAPFDAPPEECEIWMLNEMYKLKDEVKNFRADRWFEIHDLNSPSKNKPEHLDFLRNCPCPVYLQKKRDDIPNGIPFPWQEIFDYFEGKGYIGARYFTNSISEIIAFAIYTGFKEISIVGVNMSNDAEYGWQKPSCEYWIGICEGLGIKVNIPLGSELLKCSQVYALESNNKLTAWIKEQAGELNKRIQHFAQQEENARRGVLQSQIAQAEIRGAQSAYQEILKRRQ